MWKAEAATGEHRSEEGNNLWTTTLGEESHRNKRTQQKEGNREERCNEKFNKQECLMQLKMVSVPTQTDGELPNTKVEKVCLKM